MYREPFRWRPDPEQRGLWLRLCRDVDVTERKGFRVQVGLDVDIALFRVENSIVAVSNICPHKHEATISDGYVDAGTVSCPLHGWCFSLRSGEQVGVGRGGGKGLSTYTTHVDGTDVWVLIPEREELPPHYGLL
jgi:3-phenylpropionate/trans-cinnamate dioxygenase ferredoxin subunit